MSELFTQVKALIRQSGINRFELAHRADLHPQTIKWWLEERTKEADLASLVAVAKVFRKSIELTDGELRMVDTPATVAAKMQAARKHLELWRRYQ